MGYETIIFEKIDRVAKIILNRPEALNTLNKTMFLEIGQALNDAEADSAIRVVVITGKGKAFCAGMDLKFAKEEMKTLQDQQDICRLGNQALLGKIEGLGKPVIAAVNGFALAGGFEILLACDFVIASEEAMIGDQHMNYGLIGAGGSPYRLPFIIGMRRAKEIVLTGKRLSGREAAEIGLVNRSVPLDQLEKAVEELAAELCEKSPVTLKASKMLMNRTVYIDLDTRLELTLLFAMMNNASEDYQEGIRAFNEKRKPIFKGR